MNNHIVLTILFLLPLSSFKTVTPLTNKDPITVKPMVSLYTATATAGTVSEGVGVIYDVEELVEASYAYPEKKVSSPFNKTLIAPSLLIDKRVNASSVGPQETFTYTIRYRCASLTEHCQDVQIEDIIPADMEIVNYTGIGGQISKVSLTGNTIVWDLQSPGSPPGQLDAGTTGLMSISVRFPCGSGAIAGTFTNTAEISASNSVVASSTADVTLSADAPTCPPTPVPTNDFIKKSVNSNVTENGVIFWDIITPGIGAAYTVEDYIDPATIVTLINRDFDSGTFLKLEIQCANSGNWYTVWEAGVGDNALNSISEIPAAAAECIGIVHPYLSNIKIFNVTAVRYTIPSSTSSEQIKDAVKTYAIDHNPFDGMTVTPPSSSAISALPNWEAPVPYAPINNCAVASDNSIGNNGMAA